MDLVEEQTSSSNEMEMHATTNSYFFPFVKFLPSCLASKLIK